MDRAEREQRRRRSMDQDRPLLANGLAMIFTGDTHFRFWHIASIGAVQPQVRSRGKIGSDWPTAKVKRLTRKRHRRLRIAVLRKIDHRPLFRRSHFPAVIRVIASRWCGSEPQGGDAATFIAGEGDQS